MTGVYGNSHVFQLYESMLARQATSLHLITQNPPSAHSDIVMVPRSQSQLTSIRSYHISKTLNLGAEMRIIET